MEDKILTAHETADTVSTVIDLEEVAPGEESPERLVPIYLVLNESNIVTDITFEETEYLYQEVTEGTSIEEIKEFIGLNNSILKYENHALFKVEVDELLLLKKQIEVLTKDIEFRDELIKELALIVYS